MSEETILESQESFWDETYRSQRDFFGVKPSLPGRCALKMFKSEGQTRVLELGCGQGRDSLFFAKNGLKVTALDYSVAAVDELAALAQKKELEVTTLRHDARQPLPFEDGAFDACYSHMFFTMAFSESELTSLFAEVYRVLRSGALHVFTVRNTNDQHYRQGTVVGEEMYENDGVVVSFFSEERVKKASHLFELFSLDEFTEGELPRVLYYVVTRKK